MQVALKVMKGCLLKVMPGSSALLTVSDYCPEEIRQELLSKATLIVARLGKVTEPHQGIFFSPHSIVMENQSRSKRMRFSWTGDTMVFADIAIPKAKPRTRRETTPS